MAITLGNSVVFGSSGSNGGTSGAISVTAGQFLVAFVVTGSTLSSSPSVSSSRSDSFTSIGSQTLNNGTASGGNPFKVWVFYCASAVGGSTTFTVSDGGGGGFPTIIVQAFNNAAYDSIASAYAVQNGTSPFVSANITTNANSGWLIGCCGSAQAGSTITYAGSNSFSADVQESNNASFWTGVIGHKAYSGATTDHAAFTNNATPSATDATTITFAIRDTGASGVSANLTGSASSPTAGTARARTNKTMAGAAASAASGTARARTNKAITGAAASSASGTARARTNKAMTGSAASAASGTAKARTLKTLGGQPSSAAQGSLGKRVMVHLIGAAAAVAAGTLSPSPPTTANLTGVAANSSQGTLKPSIRRTCNGTAATSAAGNLKAARSASLSGSADALASGSLRASTRKALSGQSATGARGSFALRIAAHVTGGAFSTLQGPLAPPGTVSATLNGQSITAALGHVAVGPRRLSIVGQAAALQGGTLRARVARQLSGAASSGGAGTFALRRFATLGGEAIAAQQGTFLNSMQPARLVSLTVTRAGVQCSLDVARTGITCAGLDVSHAGIIGTLVILESDLT